MTGIPSGPDWEARVAAVWGAVTELSDETVLEMIDELAAERGELDAAAVFETASARDYLGRESEAEPLYRRAIELGLDPLRLPQAVIQLGSTLRILGRADEAIVVLGNWLEENPDHILADTARAFLALAFVSAGHPSEGAALAIHTLSTYLPQYSQAVGRYARGL